MQLLKYGSQNLLWASLASWEFSWNSDRAFLKSRAGTTRNREHTQTKEMLYTGCTVTSHKGSINWQRPRESHLNQSCSLFTFSKITFWSTNTQSYRVRAICMESEKYYTSFQPAFLQTLPMSLNHPSPPVQCNWETVGLIHTKGGFLFQDELTVKQ